MTTKKKANLSGKRPYSISDLKDIYPDAHYSWDFMFRKLQQLARGYGYARIETPLLEDLNLYEGFATGNRTIVNFSDPENHKIAIRPEMLPGVIRAFNEHKLPETQRMAKWFYISQTIEYNEQQRKLFNCWEYGFELFGEFIPLNESHLISLIWKFLNSVGLENLILEINSIGRTENRAAYTETLGSYLATKKYELCNECVSAIETDPLQVFRCKNLECKTVATEAPQALDYLNEEDHKEFTLILEGLDELGIAYIPNPMLVGRKGITRVTFQIKYKDEQNEYFIGEGGYHEDMYEQITGKKFPCFGYSGYLEVLRTALQNLNVEITPEAHADVFLVPLGDLAAKKALRLFNELWDEKISVHDQFGNEGVKNQLKQAETLKATIALIIGQKEAMDDVVILRDVRSGMQEVFQYERIIEEIKKRLGK